MGWLMSLPVSKSTVATWMSRSLNWMPEYRLPELLTPRDPRLMPDFSNTGDPCGLPSLMEMAAWKSLPQALPPFLVLGRMAGVPEDQIENLWSSDKRAEVLSKFKLPPALLTK